MSVGNRLVEPGQHIGVILDVEPALWSPVEAEAVPDLPAHLEGVRQHCEGLLQIRGELGGGAAQVIRPGNNSAHVTQRVGEQRLAGVEVGKNGVALGVYNLWDGLGRLSELVCG